MMRMYTYARLATVTLILLAAAARLAPAQLDMLKDTTPEQRAKIQTDLMKEKLDLSADDTSKISAINLKYANKMEPIIKGSGGPFAKMREMEEVNKAKEAELKQTLSPQQFDKYLAAKEEIRQKFEERIQAKGSSGGY